MKIKVPLVICLEIPSDRSGYRRARDESSDNRHLNGLIESSTVNVGAHAGS